MKDFLFAINISWQTRWTTRSLVGRTSSSLLLNRENFQTPFSFRRAFCAFLLRKIVIARNDFYQFLRDVIDKINEIIGFRIFLAQQHLRV